MQTRVQILGWTETTDARFANNYVRYIMAFREPDGSVTVEVRNEKGVINAITLPGDPWMSALHDLNKEAYTG